MVLCWISVLCEHGVKVCWLLAKRSFLTDIFSLSLSLDILVLERGSDLKSKMWFHILSLPIVAILHKSLNLSEPWFSHIYNGESTRSAYLRLIVKVKWNVFFSLSDWVRVWILLAFPSWSLSSLASCWSLSSYPTLKIQKSHGSTTES